MFRRGETEMTNALISDGALPIEQKARSAGRMSKVRHPNDDDCGSIRGAPQRRCMERDYDLFEVLPDGTVMWREAVTGHEAAIRKLHELSVRTTNEVRVMHLPTKTLIATKNARET
jgi:hypothetical protein